MRELGAAVPLGRRGRRWSPRRTPTLRAGRAARPAARRRGAHGPRGGARRAAARGRAGDPRRRQRAADALRALRAPGPRGSAGRRLPPRRRARSRAATRSPWTASAPTASSTPRRPCASSSPAAHGGGRELASVAVRDWPGTAVRGTTEGFFGQPWTQAAAARPAGLHGPHQAEPLPVRARRRPVPPGPVARPLPGRAARRLPGAGRAGPRQPRHAGLGARARPVDVPVVRGGPAGAAAQGRRDVGAGRALLPAPVPGRQLQRVALRRRRGRPSAPGRRPRPRAQAQVANALAAHLARAPPGRARRCR